MDPFSSDKSGDSNESPDEDPAEDPKLSFIAVGEFNNRGDSECNICLAISCGFELGYKNYFILPG